MLYGKIGNASPAGVIVQGDIWMPYEDPNAYKKYRKQLREEKRVAREEEKRFKKLARMNSSKVWNDRGERRCTMCLEYKVITTFKTKKTRRKDGSFRFGFDSYCKRCKRWADRRRKAIKTRSASGIPTEGVKKCGVCNNEKSVWDFNTRTNLNILNPWCVECYDENLFDKLYEHIHTNPDISLIVADIMCQHSKGSAKSRDLDFDLDARDLLPLPTHCPILGFELSYKGRLSRYSKETDNSGPNDFSASIDRIDPDQGYLRGNVVIVSNRANVVKSDLHLTELKKIVRFYNQLAQA
jgi:hypothetical protein